MTIKQLASDKVALMSSNSESYTFLHSETQFQNLMADEQLLPCVYLDMPMKYTPKIMSTGAFQRTYICVALFLFKSELDDNDTQQEETFVKAINSCFRKAETEDCLVTLGIKPSRPDTGYGYIQFIESAGPETDKRIKKVKTFTEKPDLEMAKFFMQSGDFLWNSGIFIWSAKSILKAFEIHMPETAVLFKEGESIYNTDKEIEFIKGVYSVCKNISIDYGVMEKASNVYVRSSIIGWSDLGTYGSLYTHIPKDDNQNAVINKNALMYKSEKCIISAPKQKLLVIEGLKDYIIVDTKDVLLICKKENEQQIRQFVNDVKMTKGDKFI